MKNTVICLFAIIFSVQIVIAQPEDIKDVMNRLPNRSLPFVGYKHDKRDAGASGINNDDGIIIGKSYENVQLTDWYNAFEKDCPISNHQFILPDQNIRLLMIRVGSVTDYRTDMLLSITADGNILDQLEVAVYVYGTKDIIPVMQFEIKEDGSIVVYRLVPNENEPSIPLLDITSFVANRVDKTYIMDSNGKFQLVSTKVYEESIYIKELLEDPAYNIWLGDEKLIE